jgi:hypothetical protein
MARAVPRDGEGVEVGRGTPQQAQLPSNATTFLARGNGIEECYEPGRMPADFRPYGAAKLIPAGTDIGVNVHYTPNGKALTDHVQIGFTLAKEPDGRSETILNVPGYAFNWQLWYDTSINVPRGTKMRVLAWYDNSPRNKFNPNPKATVYYGDQTWEEMHFPSYAVVVDDITLTQRDVVARGGFLGGQGTPAQSAN